MYMDGGRPKFNYMIKRSRDYAVDWYYHVKTTKPVKLKEHDNKINYMYEPLPYKELDNLFRKYPFTNYENFHKQHRDHEIFIYGYNLEEDLFYGADYFDYRTYRHQALKRKQLEEAYLYLNDMDYVGGILLIRKKTVGVDINYRKIKEGLESLLSGSWQRKESLDGLGFLGNMKNYLLNSPDISIKLISFPYCHVKLMYHRVEAFLKTNKTFESSYRMMGDIVRDTLIFRNVILKEFCKSGSEPDIECRKKLALRLESIEERYRYAIGGILKAIYQMEMETIPNR